MLVSFFIVATTLSSAVASLPVPVITVPAHAPHAAAAQRAVDAWLAADDLTSDAGLVPGLDLTGEMKTTLYKLTAYPMPVPIELDRTGATTVYDYRTFGQYVVGQVSGEGVIPFELRELVVRFLIDENLPANYGHLRERVAVRLVLSLITRDRFVRAAAQETLLLAGLEPEWIRRVTTLSILRDAFAEQFADAGLDRAKLRGELIRMSHDEKVRRVIAEYARTPKPSPLRDLFRTRGGLESSDYVRSRLRAYRCQDFL